MIVFLPSFSAKFPDNKHPRKTPNIENDENISSYNFERSNCFLKIGFIIDIACTSPSVISINIKAKNNKY